jgi:hypothetical protein
MKKDRCVFTITHNEPALFPTWWYYYQKYFDWSDIYICNGLKKIRCEFDDQLKSRSCSRHFQLLEFNDDFDKDAHVGIKAKVEETQRMLLEKYEKVLFVDIDEFVVWRHGSLGLYLDIWQQNRQLEVLKGYEIVHMFREHDKYGIHNEIEPDLDFSRPILKQRSWWYSSRIYSKPLITRIPLTYAFGFHSCNQSEPFVPTDPDLYLLHLRKMDFKIAHERMMGRLNNSPDWNFKEPSLTEPNYQNTLYSEKARIEGWLTDWWYHNVDDQTTVPNYELIPDWVKEVPL